MAEFLPAEVTACSADCRRAAGPRMVDVRWLIAATVALTALVVLALAEDWPHWVAAVLIAAEVGAVLATVVLGTLPNDTKGIPS